MARPEQQLISDELAQELQDAGLRWRPQAGDHFLQTDIVARLPGDSGELQMLR